MLYKGYSIQIWKSEWIGKYIDGLWYSLNGYSYREIDRWATKYKYVALVDEINPQQSRDLGRFHAENCARLGKVWYRLKAFPSSALGYGRTMERS
ncbi:hypothetical protein [Microcoleus sp. D3_18a_C4]|uniref:hypothetical protein n=1 Tax=Microcoleus sp. D3_18a_C4 TaxID=3055332 RepID=UPI002FD53AA0